MRGLVTTAALLAIAGTSLGGCAQDKELMCTIYQTFGEAKIPIKTVEVKNNEECNALLEQYKRGL